MEEKRQLQTTTVPIFADVVMVQTANQGTDANQKFKKSSHVRVSFVDTNTSRILGDFVISISTAEALKNILENSLNQAENFQKGKLQKTENKPKSTAPENQRYIG